MSLVSERFGVLRFWIVSPNITILVILISLVKYFSSVFTRGRKLKSNNVIFWCPLCTFFYISSNFILVVALLLVVFFRVGDTINVYGTINVYDTIHVYNTIYLYGYCSCETVGADLSKVSSW